MPGISRHTSQDGRDLELLDSVHGSVTACANISRKLDTLSRTTSACLNSPLSRIISGFISTSQSYTNVKNLLQRREPVQGQNISLSIWFTQECCQKIATELSTILGRYGEWDVLAPDGSYRHLSMLSKSLEVQKLHHDLLFRVLDLVSIDSRNPAGHGSPASIFMPACSEEQFSHSTETERALDYNLRVLVNAAGFADQEEMNTWFRDYAKSCCLVRDTIGLMKKRLKELQGYHATKELSEGRASLALQSEDFSVLDDWSSTNSTTGIMTPTETRSDLGSDTTEIGRVPAITRHSLQLCGYATASFLRLIEEVERSVRPTSPSALNDLVDFDSIRRLNKAFDELAVRLLHALDAPVPSEYHLSRFSAPRHAVTRGDLRHCIAEVQTSLDKNTIVEQSFGQLLGSTTAGIADIESMHRAYHALVIALPYDLAEPGLFQIHHPVPAPVPAPVSVPEVPKTVLPKEQNEDINIDKALEAIIDSMEATPTDKDIMKLVFHWTTLNECNGFKRADVMKLD